MRILPLNNILPVKHSSSHKSKTIFLQQPSNNITNLNTNFFIPAFKGGVNKNFELFYSEEELKERTSPQKLTPYKMLDVDSKEYQELSLKDKKVLEHLVKASDAFEDVYKKLDDSQNLEFERFLNTEIKNGNNRAKLTKKLYDAQRGIFARDALGNPISLIKNLEKNPARGVYPQDLNIEEFHKILIKMLNEDKVEEVKNILNQRSIVVRDGENLKAIDYTEAFKKEFSLAAEELEKAAEITEDENFKEYLLLQAKALRKNDSWLDCEADKKWATLQNTTLEFTLSRESYDDKMTPSVVSNKELKMLLDEKGIIPYAKDNLGARVGIVDKAGTEYLLKIKEYLPYLASKMPYNSKYSQTVTKDSNMSMADVDIVHVSGDKARYRGGISLASILPNPDKLSVKNGGGYRAVYLKQMRDAKYSEEIEEKLKALLSREYRKYFSPKALHDFTILHENMHSLGPKENFDSLGNYKFIIEEHKADMAAIVMLDELKKIGFYTEEQQKEILTSWIFGYIKPGADFSNAHTTRNIMQHNYLIKNGAIVFDSFGKVKVIFMRVTECAREMLNKAIRIQLSGDPQRAKEYIDNYAVFSKELETLADKLNSVSKRLNSYVTQPLAEKLLKKI